MYVPLRCEKVLLHTHVTTNMYDVPCVLENVRHERRPHLKPAQADVLARTDVVGGRIRTRRAGQAGEGDRVLKERRDRRTCARRWTAKQTGYPRRPATSLIIQCTTVSSAHILIRARLTPGPCVPAAMLGRARAAASASERARRAGAGRNRLPNPSPIAITGYPR
jgi:hypothetical protein